MGPKLQQFQDQDGNFEQAILVSGFQNKKTFFVVVLLEKAVNQSFLLSSLSFSFLACLKMCFKVYN